MLILFSLEGANSAALLRGSGLGVFRRRWSQRRIVRSRSYVARRANCFRLPRETLPSLMKLFLIRRLVNSLRLLMKV